MFFYFLGEMECFKSLFSPKKNVKIQAYSEPLIREIAEKQTRWVIDNSRRIMFHIFENNIHCGYSFEWLWPDDSNEYVQNMFYRAFGKIIL